MACENCGHDNPDGARFCAGCGGHLPSPQTDASYPLLGQVVGGRYHIVERIGEGGMGVVYKAEQRLGSTLRKVAVKTLHAELSRDPSITARFHREVGTIAQLEHPNTVKVYDFGSTDDGTLYIAMEFLDGRPLNRVIQTEGALEPRRVANLLRQIAGSLDEAHRQGIIHRDLKPENVLLIERAGEKDVVKLVDFGIAARTESADRAKEQKLTQQGMVLGTPPYMSPEQFTGKALDARTDVYSLGIMTYEMLTAQLPFEADTPWQWATHHMTSQPRSFDDLPGGSRLPEAVRRAVLKALSKDPNDRQSSAGQFQAEFSAALVGVGTVPPRPAAAPAGNKTEAMKEATPFAVAATEAMAASPLTAPRAALASPPGPVALPPAPARETSTASGGRGLIYGLSGVGAVLLVAMGVVLFGNRTQPSAEPALDLRPTEQTAATREGATETTAAGETEITPEPPAPTPEPKPQAPRPSGTKTTAPASSSAPPKAPTAAPATTPTTPPPKAPASTSPQPPSVPAVTPPAVTPPVVTPPAATPPSGDACATCLRLASKDALGAAAAYASCTNQEAKAKCGQRVGAAAPNQAVYAANNGNCSLARQIMTAATGMGVSADRFKKSQAVCK